MASLADTLLDNPGRFRRMMMTTIESYGARKTE